MKVAFNSELKWEGEISWKQKGLTEPLRDKSLMFFENLLCVQGPLDSMLKIEIKTPFSSLMR